MFAAALPEKNQQNIAMLSKLVLLLEFNETQNTIYLKFRHFN